MTHDEKTALAKRLIEVWPISEVAFLLGEPRNAIVILAKPSAVAVRIIRRKDKSK